MGLFHLLGGGIAHAGLKAFVSGHADHQENGNGDHDCQADGHGQVSRSPAVVGDHGVDELDPHQCACAASQHADGHGRALDFGAEPVAHHDGHGEVGGSRPADALDGAENPQLPHGGGKRHEYIADGCKGDAACEHPFHGIFFIDLADKGGTDHHGCCHRRIHLRERRAGYPKLLTHRTVEQGGAVNLDDVADEHGHKSAEQHDPSIVKSAVNFENVVLLHDLIPSPFL